MTRGSASRGGGGVPVPGAVWGGAVVLGDTARGLSGPGARSQGPRRALTAEARRDSGPRGCRGRRRCSAPPQPPPPLSAAPAPPAGLSHLAVCGGERAGGRRWRRGASAAFPLPCPDSAALSRSEQHRGGGAGRGGAGRAAEAGVAQRPPPPRRCGTVGGRGGAGEKGGVVLAKRGGASGEGRGLQGGAGLRRPRVLRGAACPGAAGAGVALSVSRAPGGLRFFSPLL